MLSLESRQEVTRILAIDPGVSNGYALIQVEFEPLELWLLKIGTLKESELFELVQDLQFDEMVVEAFRNRPQQARKGAFDWASNETSQVIGALKLLAAQKKIPLVLQEPAQKVPGYGYLKKQYVPGRRDVHHFDALAHGAFRLVSHYKVPPPQLQWSKRTPH